MRVIISAGGTGGHIYPALAILDKIKDMEPNSEFLYIGTHNRMECDIVPEKGIPFKTIEVYGLDRKHLTNNVKTIKCFFKAYKECKKIIKEFKPDIVIGVGGYVTAPLLYAAHRLKIKTYIHEQNSVPGASNKFLSRFVDGIGVSFKGSLECFPRKKTTYTGNPCSESALKAEPILKTELGLSSNKKLVLFVMGSLGAYKVNEYLTSIMPKFKGKDYEVLFVTGKNSYEYVIKHEFPSNVKVVEYVNGLTRVMKRCDLIVSRAGASTLSEIISLGLPSILIPSPYVPNNHQYKNALDLVNREAAILVEEKDLKGDIIVEKIDMLINDDIYLREMKKKLKELSVPNSAALIYSEIKKIIDRK